MGNNPSNPEPIPSPILVSDDRKTSNGCAVARRVPRKDAGWLQPSECVAAIDFGTTNCSVAYILPGRKDDIRMLLFHGSVYRVPTAILFDENGTVKSFGRDASRDYRRLDDSKRLDYAYFARIKMNLKQDETVNRRMKVKAKNNKEYYLVEVIAHILKYLKNELIQSLNDAGYSVKATDFDWVITVPAIWKARGKQMMREAGYKAGLCSRESCSVLEKASDRVPEPIKEDNPEKLSLALEPESASIYCHRECKQQLTQYSEAMPSNYLTVDIGGGTVDIAAHKRKELHYVEVLSPSGNDFGGARVNEEFQKFLKDLVEDDNPDLPDFHEFVSTSNDEVNANHLAVLDQLLNETFEATKVQFGNREGKQSVELPKAFLETYDYELGQRIAERGQSDVELVGPDLKISSELMSTFFKPVKEEIIKCIEEALEDMPEVEVMYLVGGFGGSKYIKKAIQEHFKSRHFKCIVPMEPPYAVVRGALLYKQMPNVIKKRKADATYGIKTSMPFINGLHDIKYHFIDDDGKEMCKSIFKTIIERGDVVDSEDAFVCTFIPIKHNQTEMAITFCSSEDKDIFYVTGERSPKAIVKEIGNITIHMSDLTGDKKREVDVTFSFSHTEIQAGLCSNTPCGKLKGASNRQFFPVPEEDNPEKLTLVLEPEAAAVYCQHMTTFDRARHCHTPEPFTPDNYLVVDIGGGTVDIIAYCIHEDPEPHMEVIHPPAGGSWGGTQINLKFQNYLESLTGDKGFANYLTKGSEEEKAKHQVDLDDIIYENFESQKPIVSTCGEGNALIELKPTFQEKYGNQILDKLQNEMNTSFRGNEIRITYEKLETFFDPVVEGILKCMEAVLKVHNIRTIYLVGGFGGCKYIYKMVQRRFGDKYRYITPENHCWAVVKGAAMMRKHTKFLRARCVNATYGVQVSIPFEKGSHEEIYRIPSADNTRFLCTNIFSTFVEQGDVVNLENVYMTTYTPQRKDQEFMRLQLYSSSEKDVWYTTGKRPSHSGNTTWANVQKIGELIIPFRKGENDKDKLEDRKVDVMFDFSTAEIKVEGYDRKSGTKVRVTLDFFEA